MNFEGEELKRLIGKDEDEDDIAKAFTVLLATLAMEAAENAHNGGLNHHGLSVAEMDARSRQLWFAAQPDTTVKMTDISEAVNGKIPDDIREKIGRVYGCIIQWFHPKIKADQAGHGAMEIIALAREGGGPPPDVAEYEELVTKAIAEACAEIGYFIPSNEGNLRTERGSKFGADSLVRHFNDEYQKKLDGETAKFREELDTVFDTWKGGNSP